MRAMRIRALNISTFLLTGILLTLLVVPCLAEKLIRESDKGTQQGVTIKKWTYTSDGLLVNGELYLPPGRQKMPLILFNHDGISGISKEHRLSSIRMAKAGFVVFSPSAIHVSSS